MENTNGNRPFMQITNKEIYAEIQGMRKDLEAFNDMVRFCNGKIKNNQVKIGLLQKLVYGSFAFSTMILGFLVAFLLN